ncbi:MAG TPA: ribonuclease HI family protein, partial [Ktedonobacterales bacterium]|nr:ribonuclease HI family protein [Ktedonobacterales bacterium]
MPQASQPHDTAYFDGSADPNPGGRIGIGWNIEYADGSGRSGAAERAPAPDNTNNVAEYLGLIAALEAYLEQGGTGPLLIHGDSQLVIMQMTGQWGIKAPGLFALNARARELAARVAGGVRYQWVPRARNAVADQLASGMRPDATAAPLIYAQTPPAGVAPRLAARIAALNRAGRASFKECMGLR